MVLKKKLKVNSETRCMCDTCKFFVCHTRYFYRADPPEPPQVDAGCKLEGKFPEIWDRMETEAFQRNSDIGQGYPCFLWQVQIVEWCEKHQEQLDPDYGCVSCFNSKELAS